MQSRLDGGVELDGSRRQLLETTPQELPGHHVLEHSRAHSERRPALSVYSQVSLQGCHQSLMPTYRLPQRMLNITTLDEVGMASDHQQVEASTTPMHWCTSDEGDQVSGVALRCVGRAEQPVAETLIGGDIAEQPACLEDYVADANAFAVSYCRDFRALHQLNHDHDCTNTCVKYVQKKCKAAAEEALRRGSSVACRFSSSTSWSLLAVLYSLQSVLGRMLSSVSGGKGTSSSMQPTSPAQMTETSSARLLW